MEHSFIKENTDVKSHLMRSSDIWGVDTLFFDVYCDECSCVNLELHAVDSHEGHAEPRMYNCRYGHKYYISFTP